MDEYQQKKATMTVLVVAAVIVLLIIVPLSILDLSNSNKPSRKFTEYVNIDISQEKLDKPESYQKIKEELESDYLFSKFATMPEFDYRNITTVSVEKILKQFIFSYSMDNKKYFTTKFVKEGVYCLSTKNTIKAFQELYSVDIAHHLEFMTQFYEYVFQNGDSYCFGFDKIAEEYDNDISIGIEKITMEEDVITATLYVYDYYTAGFDEEKEAENKLAKYIKESKFIEASNVVKNELYGNVNHKELIFKINNDGNFFKYQALFSKILNY
ncbi:MAG: hypothetical protein GX758_04095 [Tenericutes bacterium]|nr:hypothetical protein [Mycoplasmatota bacterium]